MGLIFISDSRLYFDCCL